MPQATTLAPSQQAEETRQIGIVRRDLTIRSETFDEAARTVDVVFTTGARRTMFSWERWAYVEEELAVDGGAVRLDRINAGGPVLDSHQRYELRNQIGVVVPGSARIEGGQGIATLQLSGREELAGIVQDIRDGIIRNISVGYRVFEYDITERDGERPLYRAVDWEPAEISFVPVPADAGAQVRDIGTSAVDGGADQSAQGGNPCIIRRAAAPVKETTMITQNTGAGAEPAPAQRAADPVPAPVAPAAPAPAPAAVERQSAAFIRQSVRAAGLDDAAADELIARSDSTEGLSLSSFRAEIGERILARNAAQPAPVNRVQVSVDEGDTRREAMGDMLLARMNPAHQPGDGARAMYRGFSMLRMAEELLEARGERVRGLSQSEIAERALHSTSDFPNILANTVNKRLRQSYAENQPSYRRWARRAPNLTDFKLTDVTQFSAMPDLVAVAEGGEIKYGSVSDGKISYGLVTFGRIFGVTRHTLINDDLRAIDRWAVGYAGSAARLENRFMYALLTGAGTYAGGNLFQAGYGNLAPSGSAIDITSLGAGRTAMGLQKGLQGEELHLTPSYLIVPVTREQVAFQYTSANYVPANPGSINEFAAGGRASVEVISDPVLDSISTTAWYLAANSGQVDTLEYAYLDGAEGVNLSTRQGFNIDGVEFKALLDFGGTPIDHRGLWRNPGA